MKKLRGFTIVELLIVIVVIGILAAITIVAFNGIQQRAKVASIQSDLGQAVKQLESYKVTNESEQYPFNLSDTNVAPSTETSFQYIPNSTLTSYCLQAANGEVTYYSTSTVKSPQAGSCTITNYATNPQLFINNTGYSTQTPAGNTASRVTGVGPDGEAAYQVVTAASGQLRIAAAMGAVSAQPGSQYNVSFWLNSNVEVTGATIECNFGSTWVQTTTDPITTEWKRYSAVVTIPTGSSSINNCQLKTATGLVVPAGSTFQMTKVQITAGPTLYNFLDGSAPGWTWNGTAHNSTSSGPRP